MVGASLAVSGAAFQGLFRNPLVSAGILGVSAGAGFRRRAGHILFNSIAFNFAFAFIFGVVAVLFSLMVGRIYETTPTVMLVLGGVIVSAIFTALLSVIKYVADPYNQLPTIVFWLLGSVASARYRDIAVAGIPMLAGMAGIIAMRWQINILSMGEKEAQTLGDQSGPGHAAGNRLSHAGDGGSGLCQRHHRLGRADHPSYCPDDRRQ